MRYLGAVLAVGITAVIMIAIGTANFLAASGAEAPDSAPARPQPVVENAAEPDMEAVRAAFEARETLLQAQIAQLDAELVDRQAAYQAREEELNALISGGEEQLTQLQDQELVLQEQIDQLLVAKAERSQTYEGQLQQANYQYYVNIQQLQSQLDEGKAKLSEALTRLGQ